MADISSLFRNPAMPYAPITAPSLESLAGTMGTGNPSLQAPMQAPKKPGAFGKGGDGWKILGIIGDALQTAGGGKATYAPMMMDLQERLDAERKWQTQLAQQAELKRQELAAKASEPTTDQRNFQWYQTLTPQQRAIYDQMHPVFTQTPRGTTFVPRGSIPGAGVPEGLTPMTEEEMAQLGLHPGGPTQPASGGF